jgi:hypothetical protein
LPAEFWRARVKEMLGDSPIAAEISDYWSPIVGHALVIDGGQTA